MNPVGNGNGIQLDGGSSSNTIGGTTAAAGNTIAYSSGIGVDLDATAGTGNAIRLNSIFSNTGLGIDLGGNGVTLNDSAGHTGPNDYDNFPLITAVSNAGGVTTVTGSLSSTASTTFAVDFFTLSSINASGYGEGRYVLGSASVMTDADGQRRLCVPVPDSGRRGPVRDGHGHRPRRQHLGILATVSVSTPRRRPSSGSRTSPSTKGPHSRSTAWDRSTRAAVRSPTPGRSATADSDGARADSHLHGTGDRYPDVDR